MLPNIPYIPMLEHVATVLGLASLSLAGVLLATMDPTATAPEVVASAIEMRLLLVPLIGGVFTMGGAIFLNPTPETIHVKIGRAFLGMFACIIAPQLISLIHPYLKEVTTKPILLLAVGGVGAFAGYILASPIVRKIYERSDRVSADILDRAEKKFTSQVIITASETVSPNIPPQQ